MSETFVIIYFIFAIIKLVLAIGLLVSTIVTIRCCG